MSELTRGAQEGFNRNNIRLVFRVIKRLSSVQAPGMNTLLKEDGVVVVDHEEKYKARSPCRETSWCTVVASDLLIKEDPPSC